MPSPVEYLTYGVSTCGLLLRLRIRRSIGGRTLTLPAIASRPLAPQHTFVIRQHTNPTALGDIGLQISHLYPQEADLGYAIMPLAQGKGIASEAVRAVCDYAFQRTSVTAINAYVLAENKASVRILEKTGFVRTQVLEKAYEIDGIAYDDWVYRLESGQ